MSGKKCISCDIPIEYENRFINCFKCRAQNRNRYYLYQSRVKSFCNNPQCDECKILFSKDWICVHPNKSLRSLKQLGIEYKKSEGNQYTRNKPNMRNIEIPRDKFSFVFEYN